MNSATVINSNEAFEPNLKKDPRLVYRKVRARMLYEASALCNDITQNRGLVFFLLSEAQWRGLPGNTTQDAAGNGGACTFSVKVIGECLSCFVVAWIKHWLVVDVLCIV